MPSGIHITTLRVQIPCTLEARGTTITYTYIYMYIYIYLSQAKLFLHLLDVSSPCQKIILLPKQLCRSYSLHTYRLVPGIRHSAVYVIPGFRQVRNRPVLEFRHAPLIAVLSKLGTQAGVAGTFH